MARKKDGAPGTLPATADVFRFYFFLGCRSTKLKVFSLLGLIPVILAVVVRVMFAGRSDDVMAVFNDILMAFYLQFYIVMLALFYGTSIAAEEVEGGTLPYLLTRPVPKHSLVIGKYAAYTALVLIVTIVSLAAGYFIMNGARTSRPYFVSAFLRGTAALALGIMAYTAFFTCLGTFLKRSLIIGLMFGFGWENVIQYFPGSTQRLSVAHYLKSLLPYRPTVGKFSFLLFRLEPTRPALAVLALFGIAAAALAAACLVFSFKEYRFDE